MSIDTAPVLAPDAPWIVVKFGGSSVSTRDRWDTIERAVREHRAAGRRVLIVVSALSGVTDRLKTITDLRADPVECRALRQSIDDDHRRLQGELGLHDCTVIDERLAELDRLTADARRADAPLAWQTEILALGELLSSALGVACLNARGLTTHWLDARDHLRTRTLPNHNAWSRYLSGSVAARADPALAHALAARGEIFMTQGFIARNDADETVVLGRGGSDTSAAYFGVLLDAECVEIWTDVPGLFSANPRQVPGARLLRCLDYEEAQEISTTGARVLHPRCLDPLREARVPLLIKDTARPSLPGTAIGTATPTTTPSVKAISARKGIVLVSMETVGMWQQVGFLADVFEQFRRHGLSVDLIGSAETNVTVSLDPVENLVDSDVLSALAADLAKVCRVKVIAPCAAITLVGRGMRAMLHRLSAVLAEFGTLDVHLISQSSNNLNLTFVVDEALVDDLVPRLHALLIRAQALRVDDTALFGPSWAELCEPAATRPQPWWRAAAKRLRECAAEGTPRHVYHLPTVVERARALRALEAVDRWHYALKANPHPAVLRALDAEGFAFECVSWPEIEALRASLPELAAGRILFTPNFAPRAEYEAALAAGVRVTIDALHPLAHWGESFADREIFLRVDPGGGRGHHDKVKTGGAQSKFGVALEDVDEFRRLARRHGARIVGLHAHLGSGVLDAMHWREVYAGLASLAERFNRVQVLDIGGGLGVPSRPDEPELDPATLGAALAEVKRAYPQFALWMEPGRYLVADAGVLLARVTQVKRKGATHYVGVDAGMNSLLRPALYEAWHEIVNLSGRDRPPADLVQVVGPICESGDVLGSNRRLPECREGDVLLIAQTGAYGAVMASRYNLREPAAETVLP
ncbi:MAG TPA: bifunctional aspartate kinase/diaminopimelate decarboxylase [Rhodanobacteraceae bacterium]|nr:bifunctional aspartate kinase/diaminopimelate decarboxylase [Rhodanobacteraceae bacterium]